MTESDNANAQAATPDTSPGPSQATAWSDRIRALKNVPLVLKMLWDSGPAVVSWGLGLRLLVAVSPWGIARVAAWILNGVETILRGHPAPRHFWPVVGLEVALAVLTALLSRCIDYTDNLLSDRYTHYASLRVMEQAARLDLTTYENPLYYDRLERARVQATDRLAMIQQMGRLFQQTVTTLVFTATLLYYSPWLMVLLALGILPSFFGETHFAFLGYAKNFRQTTAKRQMDYLREVAGSREGAKEIKLFGLSTFFIERFKQLSHGIYKENVALSRKRLFVGGALGILGTLGYYGAYVYTIWRAVHHDYDIGTFFFITNAIIQASSNLQQVFTTASGIADQALFLTDLIAFFAMKPIVQSKPNALPVPRPIRAGFEFRNVSFAYPGTERLVLKDFNFTLKPGDRVALIGENGQGKTTVVKLITRLYDPTHGQILLDGIDLREYSLDALHREIGVIFQDFMRYEMTARENIAVGRVGLAEKPILPEEIPAQELEVAAHKSLADEVIRKMPHGIDQVLGRRFEGGVDLSGGEWQKIALARAYLRDAQLLILDEPTAALDARSELEVFERFAELTAGKMALFISHRFSTVRMADRIVVLEGGQLVEEGTHTQLLALGGRYSSMFEMQAASYR
jgi:ATP-binding cassette subfamily B protein